MSIWFASASFRVVRGGIWRRDPHYARVVERSGSTLSSRNDLLGLRLVRRCA